jgi:hypothetical protein
MANEIVTLVIERVDRGPVKRVILTLMHIWHLTRNVFYVNMKWTAKIQSTSPDQQVSYKHHDSDC